MADLFTTLSAQSAHFYELLAEPEQSRILAEENLLSLIGMDIPLNEQSKVRLDHTCGGNKVMVRTQIDDESTFSDGYFSADINHTSTYKIKVFCFNAADVNPFFTAYFNPHFIGSLPLCQMDFSESKAVDVPSNSAEPVLTELANHTRPVADYCPS